MASLHRFVIIQKIKYNMYYVALNTKLHKILAVELGEQQL